MTEKRLQWLQITAGAGAVHQPKYAGDAGYDLEVSEQVFIEPMEQCMVPCGVRLALTDGVSAIVLPRSSTVKAGLLVYSTVIDSGYRGPMFVLVANLTMHVAVIRKGDRIAQLLPVANIPMLLEQVEELPESDRGSNGFGSSGGGLNGTTA